MSLAGEDFHDHFSGHAGSYARERPTYPAELFDFLARVSPAQERAWDGGTGNGQAALALAERFDEVIATDASPEQIARAAPHPRVRYAVARSESTSIAPRSMDLITVAQSLHWFDVPAFFAECRRVARRDAVVACWSYALCRVGPHVDAIVRELHDVAMAPYWPPERDHVLDGYARLDFPFPRIDAPAFTMTFEWSLDRFVAYLGTWSSVRRCRSAQGRDPLAAILPSLRDAWGDAETREIVWPLAVKVGRVD